MADKKTIDNQILELMVLEDVSKAYAEISSGRMKKIRGGVLSARFFLESLRGVFDDVRNSYRAEVLKLLKKKKGKKGERLTMLAHNGKTVAVFLAANSGLYGDIIGRTFNEFVTALEAHPEYEAAVVGKLGRSLLIEKLPNRAYTYFDFPDFGFDEASMSALVKHLVAYEKIEMFYGRFKNVVYQEPTVFDISSQAPVSGEEMKSDEKRQSFMFEPSLQKILEFFEAEMFSSLLEQTIQESQLSKFASRMLAMDSAAENIKVLLGKISEEKLRLIHEINNKKQLNQMVSVMSLFR